MDVRNQLEILTSRISGRVRNITCVMQELGYLDENLEPNYVRIAERIGNLPISDELRKDMQDGVSFCQQFSVRKSFFLSKLIYTEGPNYFCSKHNQRLLCI